MKYNLIIEGCDCTGKTSLIGALMKKLKYSGVIKCSNQPNIDVGKFYNEKLTKMMNQSIGVIFDRAQLSEDIYPRIMGRYQIDYMREMEKTIKPHNVLVVLTTDNVSIQKRFDGEYINKDQLFKIRDEYNKIFKICKFKHKILIDTSNKSSIKIAESILEYIAKIAKVE